MLRFLKVCWRVARGDTKTGSYTVISDVISDNLNKICAETSAATNCLSNRAGKSICLPSILWLCPIVPCPMTPCHHLPSILSLHSRTKDKFLLVLVRPTLPFPPPIAATGSKNSKYKQPLDGGRTFQIVQTGTMFKSENCKEHYFKEKSNIV